jgi:hypothetical protein
MSKLTPKGRPPCGAVDRNLSADHTRPRSRTACSLTGTEIPKSLRYDINWQAQRQIGPPQHGSSYLCQPPQEPAKANPSRAVVPAMLTSFTSTDTESEIRASENPAAI